ncbi:MAG: hypothetical protein RLZZ219_1151 [Cyanobacteriota bacterium]|jgi:hypothetical protein
MTTRRRLSALLTLAATAAVPFGGRAEPLQSPWWEDYAIRDRYLCRPQGMLVLERNDAQAALISGGLRSTLFREASDEPGIRYSGNGMRLILQGDELTLERLPQRLQCLRTDQV